MKNAKKNIVYITTMIVLVICMIFIAVNKDTINNMLNSSPDEKNANDTNKEDNAQDGTGVSIRQQLIDEANALNKEEKNSSRYVKYGNYNGNTDVIEINSQFIVTDFTLIDPFQMVEYEFVEFKELENLSDYFPDNWQNNEELITSESLIENGLYEGLKRYYIDYNYIDSAGNFIEFPHEYSTLGEDNVFSEKATKNTKLKAFSIKVRFKNLSGKEIEVLTTNLFDRIDYVTKMDNGIYYGFYSFYSSTERIMWELNSIYQSNYSSESNTISSFKLGVEGECIIEYVYAVPEDKYDSVCLRASWLNDTDSSDYNAVGLKLIPISLLKKLSS